MPVSRPISPAKAIALVEAKGVTLAAEKIADFAAAGIVRSTALLIETTEVSGQTTEDDNSDVPAEIWKRGLREGLKPHDWIGGTFRLRGGDLIGGVPNVVVTGLLFPAMDIVRLIVFHCGYPEPLPVPTKVAQAGPAQAVPEKKRRPRRRPDHSVMRPGALLLTIDETCVALGIGKTKVYELMSATPARLVRVEIDGGVRITVASVKALAGISD